MTLIVYGSALSPFVRKVRVVLAEKRLEYTLDQVIMPTPGFVEMSPLKRIPVLRDTDRPEPNTLPDSAVISDYLEHKWPQPALYPAEPFEHAQAIWFEEYADSHLTPCIGSGVFVERVMKKLIGGECDEILVAATLKDRLPPMFDYLEKSLRGRLFLAGNAFSIADIAVASTMVNFHHAGEKVDAARWPELSRYVTEMHARPSFRTFIEDERRFLARQPAA